MAVDEERGASVGTGGLRACPEALGWAASSGAPGVAHGSVRSRRGMARWPKSRPVLAILIVLLFSASALLVLVGAPSPAQAAPPVPQATGLSDDFTHDTVLNPSLWQINGPVALNFSSDNCPYCSLIPLTPSFSSAGMEIADADANSVIGAIQSVQNFSPPITVTALVKGIVSNGHPFVFGISSQNSSSGVQVTGNLNPDDCSAESNCGNPSTCGTPANSSIAPSQCFYGIYARAGSNGGNWKKSPPLDLTPAVEVVYTLTIAVDSSGYAQFNVSAGGQLLGQSTEQVGAGPFYIIMGQSEGVPVPGPGNNSAVWISATLTPSTSFTGPSPSGASSGLSSTDWLIVVFVVVVALVIVLATALRSRRGRNLTVTVLDSGTLSPLSGAGVSIEGPKNLTGSTGHDGRIAFGGVSAGSYALKVGAPGYQPSIPATVSVERATAHTVRLDRMTPVVSPGVVAPASIEDRRQEAQLPPTVAPQAVPSGTSPAMAGPGVVPAPTGPESFEEREGWAGERVREIIRTFQAKGAVSPETALTAQELGLSRMFVRIMKRRRGRTRVFVEINGRYYLDERALQEMK